MIFIAEQLLYRGLRYPFAILHLSLWALLRKLRVRLFRSALDEGSVDKKAFTLAGEFDLNALRDEVHRT